MKKLLTSKSIWARINAYKDHKWWYPPVNPIEFKCFCAGYDGLEFPKEFK